MAPRSAFRQHHNVRSWRGFAPRVLTCRGCLRALLGRQARGWLSDSGTLTRLVRLELASRTTPSDPSGRDLAGRDHEDGSAEQAGEHGAAEDADYSQDF